MVCPMSYPGPRAAYDAVSGYEHLSSRPSRRLGWGSAEYRVRSTNITNGDYFRWARVWPRLSSSRARSDQRGTGAHAKEQVVLVSLSTQDQLCRKNKENLSAAINP